MSNYKIRNQSIMDEISENLKKTIKKWNEIETGDDVNRNRNRNLVSEESEDRLKRKNINCMVNSKQREEDMGEKDNFNSEDCVKEQSEKEIMNRKNKSEDVTKKDKIRFQADSSYNQFEFNARNNINQNRKQNINIGNFSDYTNGLKFSQQNNKTENNLNFLSQSNKILQNLENFNDEIDKDFIEMEDMIESVERELKIFIK
jgi:hypothetical protein